MSLASAAGKHGASATDHRTPPSLTRRFRAPLVTLALLGPVLIFLAACFIIPLIGLLKISFSAPAGPLSAYRAIVATAVYREVFFNTFVLAFNIATLSVLLAYPTGYMLSRLKGFALTLAFWCVLLPLWISVLVRTFAWVLLLGQNGPVNNILVASGLVGQPLQFLFNSAGVYIGMLHVLMPYALLPIYSAMRGVDPRLLQASEGLGASPLRTFAQVYLPLTLPGLAAGFLLVFLMALGFFVTPALLGGIKNLTVAMLIDLFVTEQLVWPLAAAAAFWLLLVVLVLVVLASRFINVTATVVAR